MNNKQIFIKQQYHFNDCFCIKGKKIQYKKKKSASIIFIDADSIQ